MNSELKISVSGVRGIVNESLTISVVCEFAQSFGEFLKGGKVLVGMDTRISNKLISGVVISALSSVGCDVIDLGFAATPTVLYLARKTNAKGAVIITASHNPSEWNGLKFVKSDGTFLTKDEFQKLYNIYKTKSFSLKTFSAIGEIKTDKKLADLYFRDIYKNINIALIKKKKFKIACDYCNGIGAVFTPSVLENLGCRVFEINKEIDGYFKHDPEPTPHNLKSLSRFVKKTRADIGFAQDPDGDRLAIVDEKGNALYGEIVLALCIKYILSEKRGPVAVNLSTSSVIDDICEEYGVKLYRSPVGEANVVQLMKNKKVLVGGEGNGGLIYPKINIARDSFVAIGIILEYMAKTSKTISELVAEIPAYVMSKYKFKISFDKQKAMFKKMETLFQKYEIDRQDGIKIILGKREWLHLRASNTEPIVRLIIETKTEVKNKEIYNKIKNILGV